jgi:hypothetical protein
LCISSQQHTHMYACTHACAHTSVHAGRQRATVQRNREAVRETYMWLWWNSTILSSRASCWGMYLFFAKCSRSKASSKSPISAEKKQRNKSRPCRVNSSSFVQFPN